MVKLSGFQFKKGKDIQIQLPSNLAGFDFAAPEHDSYTTEFSIPKTSFFPKQDE